MTTPVPAATPLKLDVIRFGTQQCIALNDYRIAGGKPWGGGNIEATFQVDPADLWGAAHKALSAFAAPAPAEPRDDAKEGWTGRECLKCNGTGEDESDGGRRACNGCGGTGEEYRSAPRPARPDAGEAVAWRWHWRAGDEPDVWAYSEAPVQSDEHRHAEPLYARLPAAPAETARVAELQKAWRDLVEHPGLDFSAEDDAAHEAWNRFARLVAALAAPEVQS